MDIKSAARFVIISSVLWLIADFYWITRSIVEDYYTALNLIVQLMMVFLPISLIILCNSLIDIFKRDY